MVITTCRLLISLGQKCRCTRWTVASLATWLAVNDQLHSNGVFTTSDMGDPRKFIQETSTFHISPNSACFAQICENIATKLCKRSCSFVFVWVGCGSSASELLYKLILVASSSPSTITPTITVASAAVFWREVTVLQQWLFACTCDFMNVQFW